MGAPKKIFFSYSKQPEDLELYKRINKHFAAYQGLGLLGIIDKKELFKLTGDKAGINEILKSSDIAIPLLSIDFVIDEECIQELEMAISNNVKIIPIFLRDFDLNSFNQITLYKNQILPSDRTPVDGFMNSGTNTESVFKEIAQNVKSIILPELAQIKLQRASQSYYYLIAALVFVTGAVGAWYMYDQTSDLRIFAVIVLMTIVISLIALKNVIFPNKVKIVKQ